MAFLHHEISHIISHQTMKKKNAAILWHFVSDFFFCEMKQTKMFQFQCIPYRSINACLSTQYDDDADDDDDDCSHQYCHITASLSRIHFSKSKALSFLRYLTLNILRMSTCFSIIRHSSLFFVSEPQYIAYNQEMHLRT